MIAGFWRHLRRAAVAIIALFGALTAARAEASGPDGLPVGWSIVGVELAPPQAVVHLAIDWLAYGRVDVEELDLEAASRHVLHLLADDGARAARLVARPWGQDAERDVVTMLALPPPPPLRPWEDRAPADGAAAAPAAAIHGAALAGVTGALSGKTVYLSPGHGWYWSDSLKRWATQRGNTHNIVEDFVNAEGALHYLVAMLRSAGATVIGVRELDHQVQQAIVDDGDGAPSATAGGCQLQGGWLVGSDKGFANGKAPYAGAVNPFAAGGYHVVAATAGAPTASALFVPKIPKAGHYEVKIGFTAGTNRVKDAHVEVRHAGGVTHLRVDQRRHGQSWWPLGTFAFAAGVDPATAAVVVHNDTLGDPSGTFVVADVVRWGGGMGEIVRGSGKAPAAGPTSGRPRWEECARYYTQYAGAPVSVWDSNTADNSDDVTARSRFAGWHHEKGEDALYLSWHSNAPDPARGTSTYVYGPNAPDGSKDYQATKGSVELGGWLQKTLVADIRAAFDPAWKDRGLYSAYFGEVNPSHNPDMPAALVEVAFHSTKADADFLREPRFRHLLARAMTKAIVGYFAERDGLAPIFAPEPPAGLALRLQGDQAQLSWAASATGGVHGHAATSYLVETSADGLGWSVAAEVSGMATVLALPAPGQALLARVRGRNAGGTSLPSSVLGAARGCAAAPRLLAVQAFHRLQASQLPVDDLSAWDLAKVQRLRQWIVNDFSYLTRLVADLAAAGYAVESVERGAFAAAPVQGVSAIVWSAGEQSTTDGAIDADERNQIASFLADGGGGTRAVVVHGSEVGWALAGKGDPVGADFLATWFGAAFASDDAGSYKLAASGGWFPFEGASFDDGTGDASDGAAYDVDYPDVFTLAGAGQALLHYDTGGIAATRLQSAPGRRGVLLGVPLEAVQPPAARAVLTQQLMAAAGVTPPPLPCGAGGEDAGPTDADAGPIDGGPAEDAGGDAGNGDVGAGEVSGGDVDAGEVSGGDVDAGEVSGGEVGDGDASPDGGAGGSDGDAATTPAPAAPPAAAADGCGCSLVGSAGPSPGALAWLVACLACVAGSRWRSRPRVRRSMDSKVF